MCDCYKEPCTYNWRNETRYRLGYGYIVDALIGEDAPLWRVLLMAQLTAWALVGITLLGRSL